VLAEQGAQVLHLERLARHRGSVLGDLPEAVQPSQKAFESSLWNLIRHFDPAQPIYVEAESKKVGRLRVPEALMEKMRASPCTILELSMPQRVRLLMEDYEHFVADPARLNVQLDFLTQLHGKERIAQWQQLALSGNMEELVEALLRSHYDPAYLRSIRSNFNHFGQALPLPLADMSDASFQQAARRLIDADCSAVPA
jgi:tRNA 2-selenouridine synthase